MRFVPRKLFLTRGVGINKEKLNSFEMALRNAGIAHLNIVRVSSIFPPGCKIVSPDEGLAALEAMAVSRSRSAGWKMPDCKRLST